MPKPYIYWDPESNRDLHISQANGPLIVSGEDERFSRMASIWGNPIVFPDPNVGYANTLMVKPGVDPHVGLRVQGYQYMPLNLKYYGVDVNGEPRPFDLSDLYDGQRYRYISLCYRFPLRGWVGTDAGGKLSTEVKAKWGDRDTRNAANTRGAWTGLVIGALDVPTKLTDHLFSMLHGKRFTDANWEYRAGHLDQPFFPIAWPEATAVWNAVNSGRVRIISSGGPPSWNVVMQYWDNGIADWVTLLASNVDLRSHATPGLEDRIGLFASFFAGATRVRPAVPTGWPDQETWFREVELSQFEPWLLDTASWSEREWAEHMTWLTTPPYDYSIELRKPTNDLIHIPMGSGCAPKTLRKLDNDIGWVMEFDNETMLTALGSDDRRWIEQGSSIPLAVCDKNYLGPDAPFAYVARLRPANMADWTANRMIVSFGDITLGVPSAVHNGIGLYWKPESGGRGSLVARAFNGSGWTDVVTPFNPADYDDTPVDVALAWTGSRGGLIGRRPKELRVVVDGITVASQVIQSLDLIDTEFLRLGNVPGVWEAFEGLYGKMAVYADVVSDEDIRRAFDDVTSQFDNPSFEIAGNAPGEAEEWTWESFQAASEWALFNGYDPSLAAWRMAREAFNAGFFFPHEWSYDDEAARLAASGFTAEDVGKAAIQRDNNRIYILTNHSPITWYETASRMNNEWEEAHAQLVAAVFNDGSVTESTEELFNSGYMFPYEWVYADATARLAASGFTAGDVGKAALQLDNFKMYILTIHSPIAWHESPSVTNDYWTDDMEVVGPDETTPPVGWDGWYDHLYGTNLLPLHSDRFREGHNTDPLSSAWKPGTAHGGVLAGKALTFPMTIQNGLNELSIFLDTNEIFILVITPGTYNDAAALAAELQSQWVSEAGAGTSLQFGYWSDGSESGITFGWDQSTVGCVMAMFGYRYNRRTNSIKDYIGLSGLGYNDGSTDIAYPAWLLPNRPFGVGADEIFYLDGWTMIEYFIDSDTYNGGDFPVVYGLIAAVFDAAVPDPTYMERFTIEGWVDPAAVWKTSYGPGDLVQALFDSATHDREDFLDTEWPNELYT